MINGHIVYRDEDGSWVREEPSPAAWAEYWKGREDGVVELPPTRLPNGNLLNSHMAFAKNDLGRLDMYLKAFPEASHRKDKWGNIIVRHIDGKEHYLKGQKNSSQDFHHAVRPTAASLAGGLAAGLAFGLPGAAVGAGLGWLYGALLNERNAAKFGSKQPINWPEHLEHAATEGALHALGEKGVHHLPKVYEGARTLIGNSRNRR